MNSNERRAALHRQLKVSRYPIPLKKLQEDLQCSRATLYRDIAFLRDVLMAPIELDAERRRAIDSYAATQAAWGRWQASRGTDIERRANLLERLWRQGELSTTDYLLQLRQTLDTALAGAELEARLWRNFADYLASTGQLERWSGLEGTP